MGYSAIVTSMILLKMDPECIAILPFERDTPRAIDVDTITFGYPLQTVKVEPRYIQVCQ